MPTSDWTAYVSRAATSIDQDPSSGRLLHARGTWLTGTWHSEEGGEPEPAVARFSGTLGGPDGHDALTGDQGVLIRLGAPDSPEELTLALFTLPAFFVRNAQDMLEFLAATSPRLGPAEGEAAMAAFLDRHPESHAALSHAGSPPPASFLDRVYHSVHAYGRPSEEGVRWQRLELHPAPMPSSAPSSAPDTADPEALPPDYLHQELAGRLPVRLHLLAREPGPGETEDITHVWERGTTTLLGELVLTEPAEAVTPEPDLASTGALLAPRDPMFAERHALYRAARAARTSEPRGSGQVS